MAIFDVIDDIAADLHDAQRWGQRKQRVEAKVGQYTLLDHARVAYFSKVYPGVPFGILDSLVKEGYSPWEPAANNLINYAYAREVESGTYDTGRRTVSTVVNHHASPGQINADIYESRTNKPWLVNIPNNPAVRHQYVEALKQGLKQDAGVFIEPDYQEDPETYRVMKNLENTYFDAGLSFPFLATNGKIMASYGDKKERVLRPGMGHNDPDPYEYRWRRQVEEIVDRPGGTESAEGEAGLPGIGLKFQHAGAGISSNIAGGVRTIAMGADAPLQELVGLARSGYTALPGGPKPVAPQLQSDLAIFAQTGKSSGQGLFVDPDSAVARERREREAEYGKIGDHNLSIGRIGANAVGLSVDSVPFDIVSGSLDALVQLADPTALAAGKVSRVSAARRLFAPELAEGVKESAGLFTGLRKAFNGPRYSVFSQTEEGRLIKETLAGETNVRKIAEAMHMQHDPKLYAQLADARTEDEVDGILAGAIGTQIRATHELDKIPYHLSNESLAKFDLGIPETRLYKAFSSFLPDPALDTHSRLNVADNLMRFGRMGKVPEHVLDDVFNDVARGEYKEDYFAATKKLLEAEDGVLHKAGVQSKAARRRLTQMFDQQYNDALDTLVDDVASDSPVHDLIQVNGQFVQDLRPELLLEHIDRYIPLPDINRIRRTLRDPSYRWLTTDMEPKDIGKAQWPLSGVMSFTEKYWKPAMLIGRFPAWVTRVVGEEQIRMMIAGLDTAFNHPISAMASIIGKKKLAPGVAPSGDSWDEIAQLGDATVGRNQSSMYTSIRRPGGSRAVPIALDKLNADQYDDYKSALASQLAILHKDPVSNRLLNSNIDETVSWLYSPDAQSVLSRMRAAEPARFADETSTTEWMQNVLSNRIRTVTGQNGDLFDAIQTGKLNNVPIFGKGGKLNKDFVAEVEPYIDEFGPRFVKGFESPTYEQLSGWDRATDWMFAHTMTVMTNKVSRIPTVKQYTWRHTAEMLPFATKEVQQKVLTNALNAGASHRVIRSLNAAIRKGAEGKIDDIYELENLALGYAVDSTKRLLYDLSKRGQITEMLKVAIPFGNAWQEIISSYSKMLVGRQFGMIGKLAKPIQVGRRAQQVIQGARNNGWFMKNEYGDEVFVFPFSELIMDKLTGVPQPITGPVAGLNMVTDIFPGMGPVAAVPLAFFLRDKPGTFREVYDALLPYGAPGEKTPDQITNALSYMPAWMQKMALAASQGPPPGIDKIPGVDWLWPTTEQAAWDNNAFLSAKVSIMQYKLSTGDYDVSGPNARKEMERLLADSEEAAKDSYWVRAAMQFFAPTAPQFRWLVEDKSGKTIAQAAITEEYYTMLDEGMDLNEATIALMDKYGDNIFSLTIPKTKGATYAIPRTVEGGDWMTKNKDIVRQFPGVFGFFAPQGGEYDYSVLVKQMASGKTEALTDSEWLNLRNEALKTMQYNYYKDMVGNNPSEEQEAALSALREELDNTYPSSRAGILDKPEHEELIPELYDAIENPKLRKTEVGKALEEYFYYRDKAVQVGKDAGYRSFDKAVDLYPVRQSLSDIAKDIMKDYPDFKDVWTMVLSREFERELR